MPEPISCNCVPPVKRYEYGSSRPVDSGDTRTEILPREYYQDQTISEMELPVCRTIGEEAFRESSLTEILAPECTEIGTSAFYGCGNLADVYLPSVSVIPTNAFYDASVPEGSVSWDFSGVEKIQANAFRSLDVGSTAQLNIDFSSVQEIGSGAFAMTNRWPNPDQSNELILPNCTKIGAEAFEGSWSSYGVWLKHFSLISLPRIETIEDDAFSVIGDVNNNIEIHFGPYCTTIGRTIFWDWGCQNAKLYIHAVNPPTLQGYLVSNLDYDQPFRPPLIYVPAESVNTYKEANRWSAYASRISAIPEGTILPT